MPDEFTPEQAKVEARSFVEALIHSSMSRETLDEQLQRTIGAAGICPGEGYWVNVRLTAQVKVFVECSRDEAVDVAIAQAKEMPRRDLEWVDEDGEIEE